MYLSIVSLLLFTKNSAFITSFSFLPSKTTIRINNDNHQQLSFINSLKTIVSAKKKIIDDDDDDIASSSLKTAVLDNAEEFSSKVDLPDEISSSFLQYALSIILGRALPDARDGLKPVHRRIIYAMSGLGLTPNTSHRKCARVVGEVIGKYHPHGDMAVYDALVRLAQDFATGTPLVDGHGNFGSVDADPAAAMRYTECRLTPVAQEALLDDLYADTVDFIPNFDGNEMEPLVLPSKLPILLLNGCAGIAVGMATNVPPHNLGELMDACIYLLQNKKTEERDDDGSITQEDKELFKIIPGPDFPTGANIIGSSGIKKLYSTGNGSVIMRATTHIEQPQQKKKSQRSSIIVTELPYQVNKSSLLEKIANLVNEKKIDGISDLRDESDRDGIRIVIELKRDAVPDVVLNNLFKQTPLQQSFPGNFLALMKDSHEEAANNNNLKPVRFTLRSALEYFLDFRFSTIRRRTQYLYNKAVKRVHIVNGLLIALEFVDEVIEIIRSSPDTPSARERLMNEEYKLQLSKEQAEAVLKLQLGQLTRLNSDKLTTEKEELEGNIVTYENILGNDAPVYELMKDEFKNLKKKFGIPRRTKVLEEEEELSDIDFVLNARSVIVVTRSGFIKRMPLKTFESQRRGTRGKKGTSYSSLANDSDSEEVTHCFTCNDHDTLLFLTLKGIAYGLRAYQVPTSGRTSKGFPLPSILPIKADDRLSSILPVSEFTPNEYCVLVTEHGWIKKTPLDVFQNLSSRGLIIASLENGDRLRFCEKCTEEDDILVGTYHGMASRFQAEKVRSSGRTSRGVMSMKLKKGDKVADMSIIPTNANDSQYVLVVTSNGYGKRIATSDFRRQNRNGVGVIAIKFKASEEDDVVSCLRIVKEGDEVLLVTAQGVMVRQNVKDISVQGRTATGVTVQKIDGGDKISSVSIIPALEDEIEE